MFKSAQRGDLQPIQEYLSDAPKDVTIRLAPERVTQLQIRYPDATKNLSFFTVQISDYHTHFMRSFGAPYFHLEIDRDANLDASGFQPYKDAIALHEIGHMYFDRCRAFQELVKYLSIYLTTYLALGALLMHAFPLSPELIILSGIILSIVSACFMVYKISCTDEWEADLYGMQHSTRLGMIYYIEENLWASRFIEANPRSLWNRVVDPHPDPGKVAEMGKVIFKERFGVDYAIDPTIQKNLHTSFKFYLQKPNQQRSVENMARWSAYLKSTWQTLAGEGPNGKSWVKFYT